MTEIVPLRHQTQLAYLPFERPDIRHHFLIGGYSSGKSFSDVLLAIGIAKRYWQYPVNIGIGSSTITMLKKSVIQDFEKVLIETGSTYKFNRGENQIRIGKCTFTLVATGQPENIYAYNFNAFLCDELDELEQSKALDTHKAIQERVRVPFPDGRQPFTAYTTTAQGYRGTYQIIEDLKESNTKYTHIRANTKDNPHNAPGYYENLYKLYTPNERMAYLEGRFVNLTAGRVYPEYDESRHMVDDFQIEPMETVHVGQDLNRGFSKATAWVKRDKKLYCIKEFSFDHIGNAPKALRNAFPTNRIVWYPDASGKEIMAGYTAEIREQAIEIRFAAVNPNIIDRIFIVNKLFGTDRAYIVRSLRQLPMALKTRQFDKNGDPEKGQGEKATDHIADCSEYALARIVASDPDFFDLYKATRTYQKEGA